MWEGYQKDPHSAAIPDLCGRVIEWTHTEISTEPVEIVSKRGVIGTTSKCEMEIMFCSNQLRQKWHPQT